MFGNFQTSVSYAINTQLNWDPVMPLTSAIETLGKVGNKFPTPDQWTKLTIVVRYSIYPLLYED